MGIWGARSSWWIDYLVPELDGQIQGKGPYEACGKSAVCVALKKPVLAGLCGMLSRCQIGKSMVGIDWVLGLSG